MTTNAAVRLPNRSPAMSAMVRLLDMRLKLDQSRVFGLFMIEGVERSAAVGL
ncbi:hypothetical protein SBE55_25920 [Mycolicibacterium sp. 141076]|uniref:hypothetical protein n=1 Tax=Mycolicibacterium sp. 141076 TaxID=3090599 RepID=UPI00299E74B1|nr:hypothetical protein [Mycolicibacterium sp. 141076]MDX1881245.1 hypothetical protein [Mycolicibacterium sp. 141076]